MVASTNHLDQLDPGLASRPSRFDRKYLFPLPSADERVLYCEYWRAKLASKPAIKFPKKLSLPIAGITEDFSFAYLKEAFVATLLVIAGRRSEEEIRGGGDDEGGDLDDYELWREMKKTVKSLRDDMDTRAARSRYNSSTHAVAEDLSWKDVDAANEANAASAGSVSKSELAYRPKANGVAKREENPRLIGVTVDCDARHVPLMTDGGMFMDSRFGGVKGTDLLCGDGSS